MAETNTGDRLSINTRFLSSILKSTDNHNQRVIQEEEEMKKQTSHQENKSRSGVFGFSPVEMKIALGKKRYYERERRQRTQGQDEEDENYDYLDDGGENDLDDGVYVHDGEDEENCMLAHDSEAVSSASSSSSSIPFRMCGEGSGTVEFNQQKQDRAKQRRCVVCRG